MGEHLASTEDRKQGTGHGVDSVKKSENKDLEADHQ